jgi:hypothetical protein
MRAFAYSTENSPTLLPSLSPVEKLNQPVENYFLSVESLWNLWGKAESKIRNIKFVKIPNLSGFDPLLGVAIALFTAKISQQLTKTFLKTKRYSRKALYLCLIP